MDEAGVAVITIDRPARRNALSLEIKKLLAEQVERVAADDAIRVVILTGAAVTLSPARYRRNA